MTDGVEPYFVAKFVPPKCPLAERWAIYETESGDVVREQRGGRNEPLVYATPERAHKYCSTLNRRAAA